MESIVRISSLEMTNIRNVRQGTVVMPNQFSGYASKLGELLGVYGQNGSGKTSIVHAFLLLRRLLGGKPLDKESVSLITVGEDEATLVLSLTVESGSVSRDVRYQVTIGRDGKLARVRQESLSTRAHMHNARLRTIAAFHEPALPNSALFAPESNYSSVRSMGAVQELMVNKVVAYQERSSYIFNKGIFALLSRALPEYADVLLAVNRFAASSFFIIDQRASGLVHMDCQPIPISHALDDCDSSEIGRCFVNLNTSSLMPMSFYREFRESLEAMNRVVCRIIPDFCIKVKEFAPELGPSSEESMRFELLSSRAGRDDIALKYESDGIKKIISMLLYWIIVSNTPGSCLVIDELDASIFEHLLGELLFVWRDNAKGQLIFTAHNLHPLEMLDKGSVMFTTTDAYQRFIRLKNVKPSNNLRDLYLRTIIIGGQEYELYEKTNNAEIARAIRNTLLRI